MNQGKAVGASLELPHEVRARLQEWMGRGYPHETCGVLVGHHGSERATVVRAVEARNLNTERAHDRFELDPGDYLTADTEARREGLEIIGIWHSHPDHPACPSETDRAAAWAGFSYLIAALAAGGVQEWRCWRLVDNHFVEERIVP